ncbi:MAG: hypothetical protein U0R66_15500 [Mycobacterium sp.]
MTGRRRLHDEAWSWTLEEIDEGLVLTVLCGTVGLYERAVLLEPDEVAAWQRDGPAGLEPLAEAIRYNALGEGFNRRWRPDLIPRGNDDDQPG